RGAPGGDGGRHAARGVRPERARPGGGARPRSLAGERGRAGVRLRAGRPGPGGRVQRLERRARRGAMSDGEWVVEADGLTRRFGRFTAVDNVTLRVPHGSIFGFLGPSGSGKTTAIRMLCGLLKPTAGSAVVHGYNIERDPERLRQNLGYMSQKFALYNDLTVRENLQLYGGIYGVAGARLGERVEQVFAYLNLGARADDLTASLPLGWKQRVALAAAILHEPPVLFLDEPTSGVDPGSRRLF